MSLTEQIITHSRRGNINKLETLLKRGVSTNVLSELYGINALHAAIHSNKPEIVETILNVKSTDHQTTTREGNSPLMYTVLLCCMRCHHASNDEYNHSSCKRIVELLLPESDISSTNNKDCSLFHMCAAFGNIYIIHQLETSEFVDREKFCDCLNWPGSGFLSPLHYAAASGELPMTRYLLSRGVHLDAIDARGWTALHWAVGNSNYQIVEELQTRFPTLTVDLTNRDPKSLAREINNYYILSLFDDANFEEKTLHHIDTNLNTIHDTNIANTEKILKNVVTEMTLRIASGIALFFYGVISLNAVTMLASIIIFTTASVHISTSFIQVVWMSMKVSKSTKDQTENSISSLEESIGEKTNFKYFGSSGGLQCEAEVIQKEEDNPPTSVPIPMKPMPLMTLGLIPTETPNDDIKDTQGCQSIESRISLLSMWAKFSSRRKVSTSIKEQDESRLQADFQMFVDILMEQKRGHRVRTVRFMDPIDDRKQEILHVDEDSLASKSTHHYASIPKELHVPSERRSGSSSVDIMPMILGLEESSENSDSNDSIRNIESIDEEQFSRMKIKNLGCPVQPSVYIPIDALEREPSEGGLPPLDKGTFANIGMSLDAWLPSDCCNRQDNEFATSNEDEQPMFCDTTNVGTVNNWEMNMKRRSSMSKFYIRYTDYFAAKTSDSFTMGTLYAIWLKQHNALMYIYPDNFKNKIVLDKIDEQITGDHPIYTNYRVLLVLTLIPTVIV
eukprot:GHVH01001190.1.p1 GENE.GHVH01001190.1~~GHVH01001190.1.p1  ORF type:complete len:732 (+),score=76.25 GHVH01001190.1:77-2272(+)